MRQLVTRGSGTAAAWGEIRRVWETRAKLIQTEGKTLIAMQQVVTMQQLALFVGAMTEVVTRAVNAHVEGPQRRKLLSAILTEFTDLSTREEGR